jgi:Rieske Fe-S protein
MTDYEHTIQNQSRRSFLFLTPVAIVTGVLVTAAFRFLRPIVSASFEQWVDVAELTDLHGTSPVSKKISLQHVDGWAMTTQEYNVYVLPQNDNQVLSGVCPHEGCEVSWETGANRFSCPCHESYFAPDGSRIQGPARRGLDVLPTRIQDNKLQVQFSFFENNAAEQIKRA